MANKVPIPQEPQIVNVVCTCQLGVSLNLPNLALLLKGVHFNSIGIAVVKLYLQTPAATILIFNTGALVCVGARSKESARQAMYIVTALIARSYPDVRVADFELQNIVSSFCFGAELILGVMAMSEADGFRIKYDPELFPGLILKYDDLSQGVRIRTLVFMSGAAIIAGPKTREMVQEAYQVTKRFLLKSYSVQCRLNQNGTLESGGTGMGQFAQLQIQQAYEFNTRAAEHDLYQIEEKAPLEAQDTVAALFKHYAVPDPMVQPHHRRRHHHPPVEDTVPVKPMASPPVPVDSTGTHRRRRHKRKRSRSPDIASIGDSSV